MFFNWQLLITNSISKVGRVGASLQHKIHHKIIIVFIYFGTRCGGFSTTLAFSLNFTIFSKILYNL